MIFSRSTNFSVAINLRPRKASWGGANQWTAQLTSYLQFCGITVRHDLRRPVDGIIFTHTGTSDDVSFTAADIERYKEKYPTTCVIHRINDNDIRKSTKSMDDLQRDANKVADHTVFLSAWLRDYYLERWFRLDQAHSVIYNGASPRAFHPVGSVPWTPDLPFRLVTHHWSDNPLKGFDIYEQLDDAIADGSLPGVELWVIGRWPKNIRWKAVRTFPPASGEKLASLLRQCHGYVTGTRWEPGGMHHVEGLQCGLPIIYHADGGGVVEKGKLFGLSFRDDPSEAVHEIRQRYPEFRTKVLADPPSGDLMCLQYRRLIQSLLAGRT